MEDCKRIENDRRGNDRRFGSINVEYDRRITSRRSDIDRRELLKHQV